MKLLFINPSPMPLSEQKAFLNHGDTSRLPDFSVPIGIIELASYIRNSGVDVSLLDVAIDLHKVFSRWQLQNSKEGVLCNCDDFYQKELDSVTVTPDVVGISVMYSTSYYSSLHLAMRCKEKWPDTVVILGGNHASSYYKKVLACDSVDFVIRGQAEITLLNVLHEIQNHGKSVNIEKLQGVYNKHKSDHSGIDETSPMLSNLDHIGIPSYDLLDLDMYRKTSNILNEGNMSVMWSRGCPFKCTFCASHIVHGRGIKHKSNERIIEELRVIKGLGFNTITIYDDLFAAKRTKFYELESDLQKTDLLINTEFLLPNALSVSVLTEKLVDSILRLGVRYFRVAIESGSDYTQKHIIKKNVNLDRCKRILKYIRTKDIPIEVNFILGFPLETRELMQKTVDYIHEIDADWILVFSALPLPGTEVYRQFIEAGVIDEENFDWDLNRMPLRNFDTNEIGKDELAELVYDTNIDCNFFNNANIRNGRYERAIGYFNSMVLDRYPFHVVARYCRAIAYFKIGKNLEADNDMQKCVEYIRDSKQSKKMYQRYKSKMEKLQKYFSNISDCAEEQFEETPITVLSTITGGEL